MSDAGSMITEEGLQSLHAELEALEGEGRREIAERIKTAREWGDLKENAEYHDAKNEQAHLETKIARLRERIAAAVVVEEASTSSGDVVGFGSSVPTTLLPPRAGSRPNRRWPSPCSAGRPATRRSSRCPAGRAS